MQITTSPWACRLIHTELVDGALLLDLVALDPCPCTEIDVPSGTPFTIRLIHEDADRCTGLLGSWDNAMTILTIRIMRSPSRRWLCVSDGRHLAVELPPYT